MAYISSSRVAEALSYVFYADDLIICCRVDMRGITNLMDLVEFYGKLPGRVVSREKSNVVLVKSIIRRRAILDKLDITEGYLPFRYLGVPIFKGAPKGGYFRKIPDRIYSKLALWKGMKLSMAGRKQLVESIMLSMMTYSMGVFSWPKNSIYRLQMWIFNFIWTGDSQKKGITIVKWQQVCKSLEESGLGLRGIQEINNVALIFLAS